LFMRPPKNKSVCSANPVYHTRVETVKVLVVIRW
jgi:hypothetical protein